MVNAANTTCHLYIFHIGRNVQVIFVVVVVVVVVKTLGIQKIIARYMYRTMRLILAQE